jgi:hypothetical protein
MAAYSEKVFQDLGRRALQMADYEAKANQDELVKAKNCLAARVC